MELSIVYHFPITECTRKMLAPVPKLVVGSGDCISVGLSRLRAYWENFRTGLHNESRTTLDANCEFRLSIGFDITSAEEIEFFRTVGIREKAVA